MSSLIQEFRRELKYWWLYLLLGAFFIFFGIYMLFNPGLSYEGLTYAFGWIIFFNGIFEVAFSIVNRKFMLGWSWYLMGGIISVMIGGYLLQRTDVSAIAIPIILGLWMLFGSMRIISSAVDLQRFHVKGWGWILFFGILLSIVSFAVLSDPKGVGMLTALTLAAFAFISYGLGYEMYALQLKRVKDDTKSYVGDAAEKLRDEAVANMDKLKDELLDAVENEEDKERLSKRFDEFQQSLKDE